MVNSASLMISWIRPYYTMTLPLTLILLTWIKWWAPNNASKQQMGFNLAFKGLMCKPKTDFTPETCGNSVTFQAVNTWFSRQGHYVFFIVQLLPNVVFRIRGSLGVSTPFHRMFGHKFSLLPDKWSNWRLTNSIVFYKLLVLCRGVFQNHVLYIPEESHYMVFIVTCFVRRWQTCV
jgi:hypothetical protein